MPPERWQQHNITFVDREIAQRTITERLGPTLIAAEADGQLTGWWFMNKQPWPLRYLADKPSPAIESLLSDLIGDGVAVSCLPCVYEPETDTFGGPEAMDAAHELFHSDSRHLLTYKPEPDALGTPGDRRPAGECHDARRWTRLVRTGRRMGEGRGPSTGHRSATARPSRRTGSGHAQAHDRRCPQPLPPR